MSSLPFLGTQFDLNTIGQILTVFVIANSFFSAVTTLTMERTATTRWRGRLWVTLILLWAALVLPLIELLLGAPPIIEVVDGVAISNPLTKIAVVVWFVSIALLLDIYYRVFTMDLIRFNKSGLSFKSTRPKSWGLGSMNKILADSEKVYYPIIIFADEASRPWEILYRFVVSGQSFGEGDGGEKRRPGAVFFTFQRPAALICKNLAATWSRLKKENDGSLIGTMEVDWSNVVVIDCYRHLVRDTTLEENHPQANCVVMEGDPYNPHELNRVYEAALRLLKEKGCDDVRVVYDALSDFLAFTDQKLATQYLRRNMIWEEGNASTLYVMRSGTLVPSTEQYFRWFANGTLELDEVTSADGRQYIKASLRGPFREPRVFNLDFSYGLLEKNKET